MEEKIVTCIVCPSSCQITVKGADGNITSIEGNKCKRGLEYAKAEYTNPVRNLTATVKAKGYKSPIISIRTSCPIPQEMQMACMDILKGISVEPQYKIGRVIYENILGTGADIILTNE